MDQAQNLRSIISAKQGKQEQPRLSASARVITVTSGKGGVGKTNFTVNLGIWFAKQDKKVVIIDADFGLANIEVLFNVWPKLSFGDIIVGHKTIEEVLTDGPCGIKFLSGGTGFSELINITDNQIANILNNFSYLDEVFDIILIDTGAGISKNVTSFVKASGEAIVVTTPEPTAISDSYTLIKTVADQNTNAPQLKIVINKAESDKEGLLVYERLKTVSERFLNLTPEYLGAIHYDNDLIKAVKTQSPALISYPNSTFSRSIGVLGRRVMDQTSQYTGEEASKPALITFMKRIIKSFGDNKK